jgi:hypothetical protein
MSNTWNDLWCNETFWEYTEIDSGRWIAVCKELKLTLQDDSFLMLIQQIHDIMSCPLVQHAIEQGRIHLTIPQTILDKIHETYNTRCPANPRRIR